VRVTVLCKPQPHNDKTSFGVENTTPLSDKTDLIVDSVIATQWRRQDLLRGGSKLEIRSWGTHGRLHGRLQQLIDD